MRPAFAALALAGLAGCAATPSPYAGLDVRPPRPGVAQVEVCIKSNEVVSAGILRSSGDKEVDRASVVRATQLSIVGPDGCRPVDFEFARRGSSLPARSAS